MNNFDNSPKYRQSIIQIKRFDFFFLKNHWENDTTLRARTNVVMILQSINLFPMKKKLKMKLFKTKRSTIEQKPNFHGANSDTLQ